MHWTQRRRRRPAMDEPGHAHELTFTCLHSYPFLRSDRTCTWLADAIDDARRKYPRQPGPAWPGHALRRLEMV
jgi:hypothetical protein